MTKDIRTRNNDLLWANLRAYTPARIGLARAGVAASTAEHLAFQLAHARARDAVHDALDVPALMTRLLQLGLAPVHLHSAAPDRHAYLLRPDLGRALDAPSQEKLLARTAPCDVAFVVADGLSATAVARHAAPLLAAVLPLLDREGWTKSPVTLVEQGRVAIGDEIGVALSAQLAVVLIGERPGLSSPDSLGAYITWQPRPGRKDAERNCISNIRPEGLGYADAAAKLVYLLTAARHRQLSGVLLKDDTDAQKALT